MAQVRALSSSTDMKTSSSVRIAQRPAVAARSCRVARQQNKQMMSAVSSCPALIKPQQVQRSSHMVCVAAQEAPAQQNTATKVRWTYMVKTAAE